MSIINNILDVLQLISAFLGVFYFCASVFAFITPSKKNKTKWQKLGNILDRIGANFKK